MKITPAHDFNDFEVGQRHGLPMPSVLDRAGAGHAGRDRRDAVDGVADPAFLRTLDGQDRFAARKRDRRRTGAAGAAGEDRAAHPPGAARRPLRRADRAAADDAVVSATPPCWRSRRSRRWRAAGPRSCRSSGRTRSSPGCATSSPGASAASSGGAIAFPPGTRRTARVFVARDRGGGRRRAAQYGRDVALTQDEDVLDTWFSSGAVAVLDARLAGADAASWRAIIRATCW